MHGNLPTNAFRVGRHLTSDSSCKRCGASIESLLHTFRDCPLSLAIWDALLFNKDTNFNSQDFNWWFKHYALAPNGNIFVIACWVLWKARNHKVFNGNDWVNWVCLSHIYSLHSDVVVHLSNDAIQRPIRQVKWIPPLNNIIKVNVDGSSLSNPGRSGFGGLIRNNNGDWLLGFSGFCDITSCLAAELYAIFHGLRIAYDAGHKNIILESDSMMALDLIMSDVQSHHPHAPLISQIVQLQHRDWIVNFHHTLRQGNECADWLAKHGASSSDAFKTWIVCPPQLHHSLLDDALGVARMRL